MKFSLIWYKARVIELLVNLNSLYKQIILDGWLVGFYGISTFVDYLMPNPFLCKLSVLFQTIQFSMSTQFVKNVSISSYSVYSNSSNSAKYKFIFCLHTIKCQNSSIYNNSV